MPLEITHDDSSSNLPIKWCTSCVEQKPISHFHRDSASPDGYKNQCVDCRAKVHAENAKSAVDPRLVKIEEEALAALDAMVAGGTTNPDRDAVVDSLMQFTGGIDGFMRRIHSQYYASPPGGQQRTKIDLAFLAMILDKRADGNDLSKMAYDDLQKLLLHTAKLLRQPVPLVIEATSTPSSEVTA